MEREMKHGMMIVVAVLCVTLAIYAQEIAIKPIAPQITADDLTPRITIDEAIAVAREFVRTNHIDVSQHYLDAARFVASPAPRSPTASRREWIVSWSNPKMFRDDIIVFVDMNKRVIKWWKNGRQQTVGGDSETRAADGAASGSPQP
jgi:hypothetical protein